MSSKKSNVYHPVPPRAILSSRSMRASARSPRNLSVRDDSVNQDQIGEVISSQGQVLRRSMKESREMYPVKRPLILESTATRNMKLALDRNIDIINHYRLSETAHVGVFARNTEEYLTNNVTDHDHLLPSPILKSPVNAEQISKQNHQIEYQNTMAWSAIAEYMSSNSNEKNNDYAKILKHPKSQTQSATSDTTIYQSLDLFQTLYKLEKLKNDGKIGFFHVTPRFNVKICNKCDFYDLVVVEEPGSNKTGLVWGKSNKNTCFDMKILHPNFLMQISLQGLSVPREGEEGSDFIPLSTLLKERQEAMFLRKKIFFGKFQELKHFQGWKLIMLWNRRRRIMERLADCALVTDERFVTAILTVRNLTYEIESETQLFCFQKSGSIPILTFFTAQTKKIDECKVIIRKKVLNIREAIKIQYEKQIEESSLREKAYEIFKNHPFANKKYVSETNTNNNNNHKGKVSQIIRKKDQLEESHLHRTATTVNVTMTSPSPSPVLLEGWSDIRAIQRLKDNALDKANRVFLLAQYMLNVSIAHLLEDLWARLNQMIIGVRRVLITNSIIHSNTTNNSNNMTVDTAIHDDVNYTTSLSQSLPLPSSSSGIHRWDLIDVLNQDMYSDIIQTKVKPSPRKSQLSSPVKPSPLQLQLTTAAATAILSPQQQSPNNTQQNQQQSYSQEAITEGSSLQNKADFSSAQWESIGVPLHWQYEGVHLCVEVALCEEDEQRLVIDFNRNNLSIRANAVRLKVIPTLFDISKAISSLLNALGNLLEALPSLKGYSFSGMDYTSKNIEDTSNVEVEVEEQIDNGGNKYMIQLAKYSSVANQLAYQRAISCTQQLRLAYSQASMPSIAMKDLYEIFKSLWEMDEEIICEQIEKSIIMTRLYEFINNIDDFRDINPSIIIDENRILSVTNSVNKLYNLENILNLYIDQKYNLGIISSYRIVINQLNIIRKQQIDKVFLTLPKSFSLRCRQNIDFMKKLEKSFLHTEESLSQLSELLRKMKIFETNRFAFEAEITILDTIFNLISPKSSEEEGVPLADIAVAEAFMGEATILQPSPSAVRKLFMDSKDRLLGAAGKCRLFLMRLLYKMKEDISAQRVELHSTIKQESRVLQDSKYSIWNESPSGMCASLDTFGHHIVLLREKVRALIRSQYLLSEAHDLLGCANAILDHLDIDVFTDMESLEDNFQRNNMKWTAVNEVVTINQKLLASKLGGNIIGSLWQALRSPETICEYLAKLNMKGDVVSKLFKYIQELQPTLETVSFLTSNSHRPRHWKILDEKIFRHCGLKLKQTGDNLLAIDVRGAKPVVIGGLYSIAVSNIIHRGVSDFIEELRAVTVSAYIEEIFENTLNAVDRALSSANVNLSQDWLQDRRMREKIFFDLHRVTNCTQLSALLQYTLKTVLTVEMYAANLGVHIFEKRTTLMRDQIIKMEKFISSLYDIQTLWMRVFRFVKFSLSGDLDRDTSRSLQTCTEDMKKIELILQSTGGFQTSFDKITSLEINTTHLQTTLLSIYEDYHVSIQSLLDTAPRLSLLSYDKLCLLVNLWLIDPCQHISFISSCFHEMFEGVGTLLLNEIIVLKQRSCIGFLSSDNIEIIKFLEIIPFQLPLDDFIKRFELQLRNIVSTGCDDLEAIRIIFYRSILSNATREQVAATSKELYNQRMNLLTTTIQQQEQQDITYLNLSFYLVYMSCFVEDVWLALGYLIGTYAIARPDLQGLSQSTSKDWVRCIRDLSVICKANETYFQSKLSNWNKSTSKYDTSSDKLKANKYLALYTALYLQERIHINIIESIASCKNLKSAQELWTGRLHLRYIYSIEERTKNSPFDVTIGSLSIPYGLEYCGGHIRISSGINLDRAIQKTLSATLANRGAMLVHSKGDDLSNSSGSGANNSSGSSSGSGGISNSQSLEMSVSCRDIADALGRICINMSSILCGAAGLRLFFTQILYLDAIGCMNFKTISYSSFQLFLSTLSLITTAIDSKDDYFLVGALKFPLNTKTNRTALQLSRRKANVAELRQQMDLMTKCYNGIILVGITDDIYMEDTVVLENIVRSIFDVTIVESKLPFEGLDDSLTIASYRNGAFLKKLSIKFVEVLSSRKIPFSQIIGSKSVHTLVSRASNLLRIFKGMKYIKSVLKRVNKVERDKQEQEILIQETECFVAIFWEFIVRSDYNDLSSIRNAFSNVIQTCLIEQHQQQHQQQHQHQHQQHHHHYASTEHHRSSGGVTDTTNNTTTDTNTNNANATTTTTTNAYHPRGVAIGDSQFPFRHSDRIALQMATDMLNFEMDGSFEKHAMDLWYSVTDHQSRVIVINGSTASGKTSIRRAVSVGLSIAHDHNNNHRLNNNNNNNSTTKGRCSLDFCVGLGFSKYAFAALVIARTLQKWHSYRTSYNGSSSRKQKNKSELMSSTTPKVNSYAYISDKFDKQRDVYKISNMSRTTTATSSTHINETVIYHSSLSFQELLGFFDSNGFWFDGILARWVRRYGCNSPSLTTKPTTAPTSTAVAAVTAVTNSDDNINNNNNASSNNDAKKYILVLDGTISASLEQMFCSSLFRSTNSTPFPNENRAKNIGCHSMSFPSGETFPLDENTSIIIESSSLSAASPGFIAQISILNITSDAMTCLQSLIYTWKRNNLFQLDHFTIWKKSLEFLYIILTSSFLKEILLGDPSYKSKNSNEDHSLAHTTSRVGSFLRILGEWLVVSHQMSIKENAHIHSFHQDKNNSSTTTATKANATTTNTKTTTSNDSASSEHEDLISMVEIEKRSSERLLVRVEMAVVHAAVWGFGGPSNGSDRRVFFEVLLRQAVKVHIPEISLPNEFSLFEAELLLEDFSFRRLAGPRSIHHSHHFSTTTTSSQSASENARNPLSHQQREPSSLDLSKAKLAAASSSSAQTQNQWQTAPDIIDSTLVSSSSSSSSSCSHKDGMGQLQFNSGRGRAVLLALKQSIKSGANVLFLGSKGTERDTIISEVLTDCSRNCMSSFATRSDISNSLIDLILNKNAHSSTTSGIAGVLKTLQDGLIKLKNSPYIHDNDTDFATYWKMAQSEIMAQQRPVREAMDHGMIFAVKTSLKTMSSANDMRQWIQKQLRSENLSVLDAPHHLYTTIFIEDLHIASIDYSSNSSRNDRKDAQKENCSEEFLRGILQGTSSYDINILNESQRIEKKVLNIWKNIDDKWSPKRLRFIYENLVKPPPIIHRASYSDPKRPILQPDNFLIRQLGLFSTSTLEYTQLLQCANLERIIQYMSIISLPQLTTQDLHLSLINGIQTCLHESPLNKLYDIKSELKELAQYTLNIFKGTSLLIDDNSYSKIEHSCSHLIHLNYDTINKFCIPLSMASNSVNTLSALLQECGHEWKRLFFDCIPSGPMRDRITQIIRAQFDFIDVKKWGVSNLWLKSLASDLSSPYGSVWLDVTRLKNNTATTSTTGNFSITPQKVNVAGHGTFSYIPLEADIDSNESFIDNTMTSTIDNNNAMPYYNLNATTFNNPTSYNMNYSNNNINSHNQSNNNGDDIHIDPPGGWNISSVLYPCALSHILRLMRVLCMQSTSPSSSPSSSSSSSSTATTKTPNILLAGLTGAPLTPAIQLAAKLCGIEVCFYNAITMDDLAVMTSTSSSSTIDTESAFQSKYAADFTSFLKRCIFRACGLKRSESGYNAVESRKNEVFDSDGYMNIHDYPISFEMNPPQRILIAINGYQHLDESSRKFILNTFEFCDAISLVDDNEIAGIAVNLAKISSMSKDTHEHTNNRSHINTKGNNTDNDNGVGMGKVNKVNFHDDNISNNSNGDNSEDDDEDDDEHVEDSSLTGRGKGNVEGDDDNEDQSQSQTASGSGSGSGSVSLQESHSCSSNSVLSDNHNQSQTMTTTMTGAVKRGSQTSGSSRALNSVRDRYGDRGIGRGRDSLLDTAGGGGGGMEYHLDEDNEEDDDDEDSSFDSSEGSYSTDAYEFIRPLNILQCANYHIVKSFLANLVASNLSLALIAHFPCSQRLRETIDINNNAAGKSNNNTAPNSAEDMFDEDDHLLDESEDIDNNNTNAASATATRRDIKDAFTLLRATSKHSSVENATSTSTSATTTEGEEEGEEEEKPKSNILGCPILSDFICRRFAVIWWAVSATDAISGISSFQLNPLTMKESKTNAIITFIKRDVGFHSAEELSTAAAVVVNTDLTVNSFIKFRIQSNCNAIYKYLSGIKQFGVFNALGRDLFASSENKGGLIVGGVVGVTSPGNGNANGNGFGFGFGQSEGLTFHPYDPTAPPVFFTENISKNTNDNQRIIEEMLTALLLDAGNLLPLLLTTSTCVDKVLFSARIILPNAERMAEIACEIVSGVIDVGARGILTRREVLLRAQKVLEEAMDVIKILNTSSLGAMNKNLRHLTSAISYSHDEIRQLETENELYNICITRTIEYERILLLQEEIYSYEISLKNAENKQNEIVEFHHRRLQRVTVRQWQTWAAIFSTQPPQEYIELMRAVLLLVNFSNIKIVQNSSDIQQEIDEAGIKRSAMSILSSADFINKLLDVDVKELNKIKMESLISINKILYTTKEFGRISYDKDGELLDKPKYNENDALYHMLREYFEALESCQNLDEDIAHIAHIIAEKKYLLKVYQMEDFSRIRYTNESYTRKKDILMERSSILQNELRFLQMKVDRIAIIAKNPENYINMISGSLDFVNREIYQMESVLRTLVGDICIAAVVFVRAGWAPEHIRQLVMKQIRDETIRLKHFVTDGPFVLGGLWDQIQMRRWTHSNEGSIPRDICSLNAMCLLYIIPRIAFVIDPQCIAEEAIVDAMSGDYVVYTTKASQFSLVQLEEWIHGSPHREKSHNKTGKRNEFLNTSKATNITSAIIITDIQAGVNEDLITFLSSEFVTSGGAAGGGSGRGGVSVRFSPLGSTYKDTLSLHQLRIILLSTKAPTVDGNGFTSPLPSSCFLNVQLLHWTGSNAHTYFIDPNPFDTALNKTPVADSSMESHMSSMLFSRCLQEMTSKIRTTADRICSGSIDLTTAEERAIITLLSSAKDRLEEEKRFRMLQIPKEVEALHFVYVSFLEDDSCWEVLKGTSETRTALSSGIASLMEFERDRLLYQSIVGELFSLPAEFIRMCDVIIQKEDFPPYALTAKSICYQCLRPLLSSKTVEKIIKTFPHSMMDTLRIVEAVSFIQEWYRKIQIKIKSTRKPDVFELKSSSSHNLLMKRLSITSNININNSSSNNIHERKDSFISIESDLKNNINSAIETNSNSNNINITERRSSLSKQGSFSRISSFSRRESFTKGSFSKGSFSKGSFIKGSFIKGNNSSFISQGSYSSSRYGLDLSKKGLKVTTSTLDLKDFEIQGIDHALCLYIHPLRSIILNSIIKYILKHVHAKSEWLVKLSLWLVTLSKTAVIPMEELKALLELIRMKFGHKRIIYSYHISLQQTLIMTNRRTMGGSFNNNCSSSSSSFNLITRSSSNNLDYLKRKHEFLFNASRKQKPIDKKDNIGFNINVRGPAEFNGVLIHSSSTFWNIAGDDSLDINVKTLYRWKPFFDNRGKLRLEQISNPKIDYIQNSFLQGKFEIEWLSLLGVKAISITNAISNTAVIATAPTGTGGGGGGGGGSVIMTGGIPLSLRAASFVGRKLSVMIDPKEIMNNLAARASPEKKLSIISSSSNALQSSGGTASGSSTGGSTVPDANSWRGLRRTSVSNGPSAIPTAGLALGGRRMSFLNPNAATASLIPVVVEDISLSFLTRLDPLSASLQGLIKANYPKDIIKESAMKIPQLLDSYHVKRNLRILEKHSCLSSIYLGMRILIMSYKSNFMQWLLVVDSLLDALTNELTQQDLLFLIAQVRPPVPVPLDDPEKRATMGSWAAGNEPTVLQTLLFTAAVTPDAVIPMIELFFHATKEFLQMGGTIASYDDELCDEDEQPYDTVINGNNSNSNNSLSGDMFNSTSTPIAQTSTLTSSSFVRTRNRGIGNMAWTGMDMDQIKELSSHEEDDEEENDDSESESESESGSESDSRSISSKSYYSNSGKGNKSTPRFKNMNLPLFGIDLSLFTNQKRKAILADALIANSWKHLRRIISGITPPNVPRYSTVKPKYRIMLRNHENWEESLLFIFSEQFSYEKYIPIKSIQMDTNLLKNSVFIASSSENNNNIHAYKRSSTVFSSSSSNNSGCGGDNSAIAAISMTTRFLNEKDDLKALFLSAHINNNNTNDTTGSNNNNFNFQRLIMEDITKRVKIQILATTAPASKKKIIIEMVDITSGLGNSILSSVSSQLLRKQTDRNTNENKQLLQNNSINMNQEGNSIMFAILNSSKSISGAGRSADRTIIKMTNSWLPRYSIPDVICTVNDWSLTNNSSFASTVHIHRHITLYEAKGMLLQELEESLLVICSAIRQQLQTTPKGVLETNPLSTLPLIALKTAAAILVLRRIVMYLNCKLRENKHHPAMWSRCLVMPNQWELARITMKCLDILKSDWQSRLVSATLTSVIKKIPMNKTTQDMPHHPMTEAYSLLPLPRDRVFIRLVCQCCETFMTVRGQREQEMEKAKDERDSRRKDGEDGSRSRTGMSNQSSRASLASTTASVTGRSSINNFSTNIKSSSNTESGGGVGMGSSFYKSGMSFSKTSKPSPSSIHDHQEIRLGGGASFKVGASFLAANKSSSNQYQPGVVVKSTYARQGRQPTRTSKAARAQALAVEQAAEELEELTLASGGKRVRDRFISISMLLFSNLLSVSNDDTTATTTTAAAASVVTTGNPILEGLQSYRSEADDMLKNIEEDLDEVNEVWPSFRAELCNIRIGGLSMDIIMSIMKEWISSV